MKNPFAIVERNSRQSSLTKKVADCYSALWEELKNLQESRYRSLAIAELEKSHALIQKHIDTQEARQNVPVRQLDNNRWSPKNGKEDRENFGTAPTN